MIGVVPCPMHPGSVDLIDSHGGPDADPMHLGGAEWAQFIATVKSGRLDDPASIEPSAGRAHTSR